MDLDGFSGSSWGKRHTEPDIRALRQYRKLLSLVARIQEMTGYILLTVCILAIVYTLVKVNFENVIFYDGTDVTCVLDGETGDIQHVQ